MSNWTYPGKKYGVSQNELHNGVVIIVHWGNKMITDIVTIYNCTINLPISWLHFEALLQNCMHHNYASLKIVVGFHHDRVLCVSYVYWTYVILNNYCWCQLILLPNPQCNLHVASTLEMGMYNIQHVYVQNLMLCTCKKILYVYTHNKP